MIKKSEEQVSFSYLNRVGALGTFVVALMARPNVLLTWKSPFRSDIHGSQRMNPTYFDKTMILYFFKWHGCGLSVFVCSRQPSRGSMTHLKQLHEDSNAYTQSENEECEKSPTHQQCPSSLQLSFIPS